MTRALTFVLIALWALPGSAQVYRHVDENGNVTFSDQPPPNAEPVEIRAPNTSAPPPAIPRAVTPRPKPEEDQGATYDVRITAPADQTIIPNGPGNFSVSASVSPGLEESEQLQLLLNGEPRGEPQRGTNWALTNVFRGEQRLSVAVVDEDGKRLAVSEEVTVFVFRPSTNR